jgi:hypothetical protein
MPRHMFSTVPPLPSGTSSRSIWEKLYEHAILELDNARVPERIVEARHAMYDRAEEILTDSSSSERGALNKALRNLGLLEEVTAREICKALRSVMANSRFEILCSICDKRLTLQEDTCTDENGKAVHTDCYAEQILQNKRSPSGMAA